MNEETCWKYSIQNSTVMHSTVLLESSVVVDYSTIPLCIHYLLRVVSYIIIQKIYHHFTFTFELVRTSELIKEADEICTHWPFRALSVDRKSLGARSILNENDTRTSIVSQFNKELLLWSSCEGQVESAANLFHGTRHLEYTVSWSAHRTLPQKAHIFLPGSLAKPSDSSRRTRQSNNTTGCSWGQQWWSSIHPPPFELGDKVLSHNCPAIWYCNLHAWIDTNEPVRHGFVYFDPTSHLIFTQQQTL